MKTILHCVVLLCLLSACGNKTADLRILPIGYQDLDAKAVQDIFEQRSGIRIIPVENVPAGESSLDLLIQNQVDLAFTSNTSPFRPGVRAVLPALESVLHVLGREELGGEDGRVSLRGKTIYLANNSNSGRKIISLAARRQGVEDTEFRIVEKLISGETDLILYFGPIAANNPAWYRPGYRFVSLYHNGEGHRFERNLDVVGYLLPNMYAYVIPAGTYDIPGNEVDIPSMATDTLLVTRKDVPEQAVYELTRTLIEQKPRFTAIAPQMFRGIRESFDPLELSFPLHGGARRYLARDEPNLLERYAESINLLVYLAFLLLTGLLALGRWRSQRKKDRIDTFYVRTLAIAERTEGEDPDQLLAELQALEREAFESLIAEKLAADESFRIFTDLLTRTRAAIRRKS